MTTEERLVDALKQADSFQPSPDLYARLERSIAEDRRHRHRVWGWSLGTVVGLGLIVLWVVVSSGRTDDGSPTIEGWRLVVAYLALVGGVVVSLGPLLRRFGNGLLEGVFLLSPKTGQTFVRVLDIAYYAIFVGLALVDADQWQLDETWVLREGLEARLDNVAFVLLAMGILHVLNIVVLPVIGLVSNSLVRRDARGRPGSLVPPESARARRVDSHVQTIVIVLVVLALAFALPLVFGAPLGEVMEMLD